MKMKNTTCCHMAATTVRVTRELLSEALPLLEQEFATLLRSKGLFLWRGSTTDLMELVYHIYANGNFRDESGYPVSLIALATHTCRFFGVSLPDNPYALAIRAKNRKGVKCPSMLYRYAFLRCIIGVNNPLQHHIGHIVRMTERRSS